jgi:hypothetical protein
MVWAFPAPKGVQRQKCPPVRDRLTKEDTAFLSHA